MKRCFDIFLFLVLSLGLMACDDNCTGLYGNDTDGDDPYFLKSNHPFPQDADTLRILSLGNSFADDAFQYLRSVCDSAGLDGSRFCIYGAHIGGSGIDTWVDKINSEDSVSIWQWAGKVNMKSQGNMRELLDQHWDILVVSQVSNQSYLWSSFASLSGYMKLIEAYCPNYNICFAYQIPWSHTPDEMPDVLDGNIECWKKMSEQYPVGTVIPTGTAIQLARQTALNDSMYMTRDNWHLNTGIARYIASCTWYQSLLYPYFGVSVVGNTAVPEGDYSEEDVFLAQKLVEQAVNDPETWSAETGICSIGQKSKQTCKIMNGNRVYIETNDGGRYDVDGKADSSAVYNKK